ncbi:helix-turn-helix domain-containing protein [Spirosoma aerolatum]|uniref:helix-turn-helix domain-containing protein n=1 Tax=Spirosoma aerolatum TaxID=1211326 RepID=UPI0009AE0885|nr:helix-turn-helix domain-containing protein [Spirosoma aerolatum]
MNITNWDEHRIALQKIDALIAQGFEGNAELETRFLVLAKAIEAFEDSIPLMPIRTPDTLPGMIHIKMAERNMKQKDMAKLLGVSTARLSEVMNGKRRITIDLAKKLYERLDISPEFILKMA